LRSYGLDIPHHNPNSIQNISAPYRINLTSYFKTKRTKFQNVEGKKNHKNHFKHFDASFHSFASFVFIFVFCRQDDYYRQQFLGNNSKHIFFLFHHIKKRNIVMLKKFIMMMKSFWFWVIYIEKFIIFKIIMNSEKFHTEQKLNLQKRELNDTFCYDEKVSNSILFFIFSRLLHDSWNLMMKRSLSLLL
jgi:hypothetical protein